MKTAVRCSVLTVLTLYALNSSEEAEFFFNQETNLFNDQQPNKCREMAINFKPNLSAAVLLHRDDYYFHQTYLPNDGEIVFDSESLLFAESEEQAASRPNCKSGIAETWVVTPMKSSWYNTSLWTTMTPKVSLLDVEQMPCQMDKVSFIDTSTFLINIDVPAKVKEFELNSKSLTTSDFNQVLWSYEGRMQFTAGDDGVQKMKTVDSETSSYFERSEHALDEPLSTATMTIDPAGCKATEGCLNSNIEQARFNAICKYVACPKASDRCWNPLQPIGSCCKRCGGQIDIASIGVAFDNLKKELEDRQKKFYQDRKHVTVEMSFLRVNEHGIPNYQLFVGENVITDPFDIVTTKQLLNSLEEVFRSSNAITSLDQTNMRKQMSTEYSIYNVVSFLLYLLILVIIIAITIVSTVLWRKRGLAWWHLAIGSVTNSESSVWWQAQNAEQVSFELADNAPLLHHDQPEAAAETSKLPPKLPAKPKAEMMLAFENPAFDENDAL